MITDYKIPNLVKAIYDDKSKNIKRFPCHSNRASSLGYAVAELEGCLRRGVYERTHWEKKELHDGRVQLIFDEGNNQEKTIYRDLLEAGYEIIESQTPYEWKDYNITGHIDGKLIVTDKSQTPIGIPVEIKSMSPFIFDTVHSFEDFKKKPWTRSYMVQITLYMLMQGIDVAIFVLKNKSSGELKQIPVELDYELGEYALKAAESINKHIANNTLPEPIDDIDTCSKCPFRLECKPDVKFGEELKIADDPTFEKKLTRYLEINPIKKEAENLYKKQLVPKMKATAGNGQLNILVGKYRITTNKTENGSFRPKIETV